MSIATNKQRRDAAYNSAEAIWERLENTMANLAARWQDESEYEDIRDYQNVIQQQLPEGTVIERMVPRPFGFIMQHQGERYRIEVANHGYGIKVEPDRKRGRGHE